MKKIIFALFVFLGQQIFAQSCCMKAGSTEAFAMLAKDKAFVDTHLDPLPFFLPSPLGKEISFKTPDGREGFAYEIKNEKATDKYVFVIHEWWGLNDYIRQESEKIFQSLGNVNVMAIDLYDKKVASSRDSAGKYMKEVKTERAEAIIKGALEYAGKSAKVASVGWCFGGGWSLQTALLAGNQGKACVMYYGMPEENSEKLKKLQSPVFFIWPDQDKWINQDVVSKFESNMKALKKSLKVEKYNADHAFANPSNPKYNKEFSDDAFNKSMSFLKENLK